MIKCRNLLDEFFSLRPACLMLDQRLEPNQRFGAKCSVCRVAAGHRRGWRAGDSWTRKRMREWPCPEPPRGSSPWRTR